MRVSPRNHKQERLFAKLRSVWKAEEDHLDLAGLVHALDARYDLAGKAAKEPGVAEVVTLMVGRLGNSFGRLSEIEGKDVLDIVCGSNTSRAPASMHIDMLLDAVRIGRPAKRHAAMFEPWFCRILLELGARPVGVDSGDLEDEAFTHHRLNLGQKGALDIFPFRSFDAIQDSRLFGSPEFTGQFPNQADRLEVAQEIMRQEQRLLKTDGIIIHSDAATLVR